MELHNRYATRLPKTWESQHFTATNETPSVQRIQEELPLPTTTRHFHCSLQTWITISRKSTAHLGRNALETYSIPPNYRHWGDLQNSSVVLMIPVCLFT